MKRCFYWYVYELYGHKTDQRFESVVYCSKKQILDFVKDSGWDYCLCSKASARTLSRDLRLPIEDISNFEE